ncbi:MAG: hypothetical protein JWM88_681 [Verrucomicrobia bacterium]|nr:hypothetical protein [Verrucomicrobiota bacterium]
MVILVKPRRTTFFLSALLASAGCQSSPQSRMAENSAALQSLTPAQKEAIETGGVEKGFSAEMVYLALGKPSRVEAGTEGGVPVEVWSYRNYRPGFYGRHSPRREGANLPESHGSAVFQSLPSEGGAKIDTSLIKPPGSSGPNSPNLPYDPPVFTLKVRLLAGKVVATRLEP